MHISFASVRFECNKFFCTPKINLFSPQGWHYIIKLQTTKLIPYPRNLLKGKATAFQCYTMALRLLEKQKTSHEKKCPFYH